MKNGLSIIVLVCLSFFSIVKAQTPYFIPDDSLHTVPVTRTPDDTILIPPLAKVDDVQEVYRYAWKVHPRTGDRIPVMENSSLINFHQTSLIDSRSIATGYLANWGSPAQSKIFFDRPESSVFTFLDAMQYYHKTAQEHPFLNTKVPYSNVYYQSAGGRTNSEERLNTQISSNFGKELNIGFDIDYVYSRGFYQNLSNKQMSYDIYASYVSERYQMHAFMINNYYNNSENGGISDDRYITNPNSLRFTGDTKDIPVKVGSLWNRFKGRQLFLSNKYNLGYYDSEDMDIDDVNDEFEIDREFIPVASFVLTTNYTDQQRRFGSRDRTNVLGNYTATDTLLSKFDPALNDYLINYITDYENPLADDQMAYWSLKNTFAVSLNEGFKEWVKFGLTAFVEQEFRKFSLPRIINTNEEGNPQMLPMVVEYRSQNSTVIGGYLSKRKSRLLRYNLGADLAVIGSDLGEFRLMADVETTIKFAGKDASARLTGYVKNLKPKFFENNLRTKYTYWNENLSETRRVFVGGNITIPQTGTWLSGGVENIQNYIYYDRNRTVAQEGSSVQIISVSAGQNLQTGIFHWDNQLAYQLTSNKEVVPLPQLSLYTNVYLLTKLAKVMTIQLGVDARFHTEYYTPSYDPSILQFYNQQTTKTGGFPLSTVYLNLHLKNTRFFAMMYNVAKDMGDPKYFSLPHYPYNPMIFKMGISWDFNE